MQDIEDYLAEEKEKAERQNQIDSDRPSWRNSLADLLEWQDSHGVTSEELTEREAQMLLLAEQLQEAGAWKLLNAGCSFHEMMAYFTFANNPREWANIHFDVAMRITMISAGVMVDTGSNEAIKSFFSNE